MKAGKNAEALGVLENIEATVDVSKLPPPQMAVLAAAMAANGDYKKGSILLSHCRTDLLTFQEIDLIKGAFSASKPPAAKPSSSQK